VIVIADISPVDWDSAMPKKSRAKASAASQEAALGASRPAKPNIHLARWSNLALRDWALGALLFTVTFIAYLPALNGGVLWDDNGHITKPELRSLHGLWRVWFEVGATQQYYPLLHSAFWIEHRLWGDAVLGYHLTNIFLHAGAACLVVAIMRKLALPGAWLGGFLFALHPVCVESVAWISEQKSTLSAVFYLGAALAYLNFDQQRRRSWYFFSLGLFVLALLSKSVTATLPAALLVVFWWQRGRLDWKRDVLPLLPWLLAGAAAGLFTAHVEREIGGAQGADYALTSLERCLLAGRVVCFYLGKLVWPVNLVFIYPHWAVDAAVWWQYLFPLGIVALAVGLLLAARWQRGPLAALLLFAGTLFPVMGFFNVYPFQFSYVADHFQYLAALGIIVPLAAGISSFAKRSRTSGRQFLASAVLGGALLLAVLGLTFRQSGMYRDAEMLYRRTIAAKPSSWLAYNNLGIILENMPGHVSEALLDYQAAIRLNPKLTEAHNNLGLVLLGFPDRLADAISEFEIVTRIKPGDPMGHLNLGNALLRATHRLPDAISEYETVLRLDSDFAEAHNNLGVALSRVPNRLPEAIAQYEAAIRLNPEYAEAHNNLGLALARIPSRLAEAIQEYIAAVRLKPDYIEVHINLGNALMKADPPGPEAVSEAIVEFETALKLDPSNRYARSGLGKALANSPKR